MAQRATLLKQDLSMGGVARLKGLGLGPAGEAESGK
jgi:hypothetical protein